MATDRNVYRIVDDYTVLGQECSNVYFYQIGSGLFTAIEELLPLYIEQVLPDLLALQQPEVVHTRVSIQNIFNLVEYAEELMNEEGTNTIDGEPLPPFVAASFTLLRETPATRSGKKRYYIASEDSTDSGFWTGDIIALGNTLATQLQAPLTIGLIQTLFPVIVKRIEEAPDEYRLPETMAEATVNGVEDAFFSLLVTTQNSRKIGVGS